jgi:hypothetical protein
VGNCGSGVVAVTRSTDGGETFGNPVSVSNGGGAAFCQVQVISSDEVVVIYEQRGDVLLAASSDGGQSFPVRSTVNGSQTHLETEEPGPLPLFGVDRLGRIDVVWSADTDGSESPDSLRYARSTDGGRSFAPDQTIAGTGGVLLYGLALRHDAAGRCHVQFASDEQVADGEYDVQYMRGE